ncbi:MAG: Fur family transcriptional regulator [Candidatus Thermoplasmatota archaeon]|nr:Fur family transcriptional regulator [Candidatus Thermoplasmatota archaeon]
MLKKYVKLLKENAIKITPQRLEILKYLDENRKHPTVDEIYSELKEKNPSLSKTTVYNSVEVLRKHGIIQSLTISGSESRYDFRNNMHYHFLCKKCGNITDVDIKCPNIGKLLESGYKVEEVHGYFKGICKDCLKKGGERDG